AAMLGVTQEATARRPERRYYKCHGRDCVSTGRDEPCPQRMAKAEELEAAVWGHVKQLLADPEALLAQFQSFADQARDVESEGRGAAGGGEGVVRRLGRGGGGVVGGGQDGGLGEAGGWEGMG